MDLYSIFLSAVFLVMIFGILKGFGENRTITVFSNYDDLGLTVLIPGSYVVVKIIFSYMGGAPLLATSVASCVALYLFFVLAKNTYVDNDQNFGKAILALATKIPLAVIWVFALFQVLNPSGKGSQRSANRGLALIVLAVLTPVVAGLVVEKSGSLFNPRDWIKGRRVGGVRNYL